MLEDLVRKVEETRLTEKDPEAEQLLQMGLGRDPDAIYKLAQTVLVQNLALNQARAQIQSLQQSQQQAQPARATSFLGGLLGHREPAPVAAAPQPPVPAGTLSAGAELSGSSPICNGSAVCGPWSQSGGKLSAQRCNNGGRSRSGCAGV